MTLYRLSEADAKKSAATEEVAMGLHIVEVAGTSAMILGDEVLMTLDDNNPLQISDLLREPWLQTRPPSFDALAEERFDTAPKVWDRASRFRQWLDGLEQARPIERFYNRTEATVMQLFNVMVPTQVYGHLPYATTTQSNDVYYRCEPWPVSRRVLQAARKITTGTYACPASELPFFPTGFSAVGRYALPNLAPACFRWELQPVPNTSLRCGASVPLHGQAGGGVEVCFTDPISFNRGPIANPVVLPVL